MGRTTLNFDRLSLCSIYSRTLDFLCGPFSILALDPWSILFLLAGYIELLNQCGQSLIHMQQMCTKQLAFYMRGSMRA